MLSFVHPAIVLSMFMLSFVHPAIVLSMFMLSFIFVLVYGLFECKLICRFLYRLFIYVLSLEIILSSRKVWHPINRFNSAIYLGLSHAKTWIPNVICCGFLSSVICER